MKTKIITLFILLFISAHLMGQQRPISVLFMRGNCFKQVNYEREYQHYCKADSNAIVVGFKFITSEGGDSIYGWAMRCVIYNPKYMDRIRYYEYNNFAPHWVNFKEEDVWEWWMRDREEQNRNCYSCSQYVREKYIRCEKITIPMKPTFEGYLEWRLDRYGF